MSNDEIWDEFWDMGACSGGLVRDCKHDITWFTDDESAGDWDDGELEKLRQLAIEKPDQYKAAENGVHDVSMLGMHWVWGCEKCMAEALKYQSFIWAHRHTISQFLNAKLKSNLEQATRESEELTLKAREK